MMSPSVCFLRMYRISRFLPSLPPLHSSLYPPQSSPHKDASFGNRNPGWSKGKTKFLD